MIMIFTAAKAKCYCSFLLWAGMDNEIKNMFPLAKTTSYGIQANNEKKSIHLKKKYSRISVFIKRQEFRLLESWSKIWFISICNGENWWKCETIIISVRKRFKWILHQIKNAKFDNIYIIIIPLTWKFLRQNSVVIFYSILWNTYHIPFVLCRLTKYISTSEERMFAL